MTTLNRHCSSAPVRRLAAWKATALALTGFLATLTGFAGTACATTTRTALVVVANMTHDEVTAAPQDIADVLFNSPDSVAAFYRETTYGAVTFAGTVLDPVSIPFSGASTCLYPIWAAVAQQAAKSAYDVDFSDYDHIIYVLPSCPSCGLDGAANIDGRNSWNFGKTLDAGIYSHELGHNLGLRHANAGSEEGADATSVMGYGDVQVHFNAAEKDALDWIPGSRAFNIGAEGNYRLAPLESLDGLDPLLLRIEAPHSNERYFVSYRRPLGFDANLPAELQDVLTVHTRAPDGSTDLHAVLSDGELFSDPDAGVYLRMIDHHEGGASFRFGTTTPESLPGDFNFDGRVDDADLAQWRGDFGLNAGSDADGDGDSDNADFLVWQQWYGEAYEYATAPLVTAFAIPEPAAGSLAWIAAATICSRRRHRGRRPPLAA
jgi:hypothetical protein